MVLNKINKPEPLAKKAFNALRHSILTNVFSVDVIYNEKSLAEKLGISRTPVREALLELSSKRLIRFLPQKGVVLNTFSLKEIEEVFEIRTALELFAIKKVCLNRGSLDLASLWTFLKNQIDAAAADDPVAFMEADRNFHLYFPQLADNSYLLDTMQDIRDIMHLMGFQALESSYRMNEVVDEHKDIINAIETGDVDVAMERMDFHLQTSQKAVQKTKKK